MNVPEIQKYLKDHNLDGWLLADFHGRNSIAMAFLHITSMVTRRSFYYIPAIGEPTGLIHAIERHPFQHLPGKLLPFSSYRDLESNLRDLLPKNGHVAMEYAANGRLPYVGLVDAGTIEFVRGLGVEIVSSADLVAHFQARLTDEQISMHRRAATQVMQIKDAVMVFMSEVIREKKQVSEYDVTRFILEQFSAHDMETQDSPICAVDANPTPAIRTMNRRQQSQNILHRAS
jgi:Xaa-Pro aminopeptidase